MEFQLMILISTIITIIEYFITKRFFNPTTILSWPFIIVIFINKIFGNKYGFYDINEKTINKITIGILFFFVGSISSTIIKKYIGIKNNRKTSLIIKYNIDNIYIYVMGVAVINLMRLVLVLHKYGVKNFIVNDGMNGLLMTGIFSHMLLSSYPLVAILISHALKKKEYKFLFPVILIFIVIYFTFVKYHMISLVLIIIIYLNIENPKMFSKTVPVLIVTPIIIFFANYLTNFNARGITAENDYILKHLINYISGGLIYDSISPNFSYNNYGLLEIIVMILMVIPNLFINLLWGRKVYPYETMQFYSMGWNGENGNVINTISFLFSSKNIIGTILLIIFLGIIVGSLYSKDQSKYLLMAAVYTFVFLSFYATFLVLVPPWEMIIFSLIMPKLFLKNRRKLIV